VNAICLLVAGALRATLPASEFTLAWDHSVEKSRWEERYAIDGVALRMIEARVQAFGAGMEPALEATLRDGWWTWHPLAAPLQQLRLTLSPFTRDYDVCWAGRCTPLRALVDDRRAIDVVEVRACAAGPS
jgi:hypothetical protein